MEPVEIQVHDLVYLRNRTSTRENTLLDRRLRVLVDIVWPQNNDDDCKLVEVQSMQLGQQQRPLPSANSRQYHRVNIRFVGKWSEVCDRTGLKKGDQLTLSGHGIRVRHSCIPDRGPTDHPFELWVGLHDPGSFSGTHISLRRLVSTGSLGSTQLAFERAVDLDPKQWQIENGLSNLGSATRTHKRDRSTFQQESVAATSQRAAKKRDTYSYVSLKDLRQGKANVYAVVVGFKAPHPTRGSDLLMTIDLIDSSMPDQPVLLSVFAPSLEQFPDVRMAGDILRLHRVAVECHDSTIRLVARKGTSLMVQSFQTREIRTTSKKPTPPDEQMLIKCRETANNTFVDSSKNHIFAEYAKDIGSLLENPLLNKFPDVICSISSNFVFPSNGNQLPSCWVTDGTGPRQIQQGIDASFTHHNDDMFGSRNAHVKVVLHGKQLAQFVQRLQLKMGCWVKLRGVKVDRGLNDTIVLCLGSRSSVMLLPPHHNIVRGLVSRNFLPSGVDSGSSHLNAKPGPRHLSRRGNNAIGTATSPDITQHQRLPDTRLSTRGPPTTCGRVSPQALTPSLEQLRCQNCKEVNKTSSKCALCISKLQQEASVWERLVSVHWLSNVLTVVPWEIPVRVRVRVINYFPRDIASFVKPSSFGENTCCFALLIADRTGSAQVIVRDDSLSQDATNLLGVPGRSLQNTETLRVAKAKLKRILDTKYWLDCHIVSTNLKDQSGKVVFRLLTLNPVTIEL